MNKLYFGDNINILRDHIPSESVDLIYLDPPFNSKRNYNVYLNTPKGHQSDAQITAFEDTWTWNDQTEVEYSEIMRQSNTDVADLIQALRKFLHESDMMAYLVMMTNRLLELHRVLKSTGSLYLHCDPTASHYLKIVLDNVFGASNFKNEIIWKRNYAHNSAKRYGANHDTILFYSKSNEYIWNKIFHQYDEEYINKHFSHTDANGRRYKHENATGAGVTHGETGTDWRGKNPTTIGRHWARTPDKLEELEKQGLIYWPTKKDGWPYIINYLDEMHGTPAQEIWDDINPINSQASERLGYPTQKPVALLERIINASSNPGDVVLDPFCGCGTAVHAAQKLGRQWIGIDITHLAIHLIERRLKEAFPELRPNKDYMVLGQPMDLDSALDLAERDKFEFQYWACSLVGAQPYKGGRKGADGGTDGIIYFQDGKANTNKIIVSVKGGGTVNRIMVADLKNTVEREKAAMGLFVTLAEPTKPMREEAASAGMYVNPHDEQFPKIQILTIESLLNGAQPKYRDYTQGAATFKKAQKERTLSNQPKLLD